MWIMCFTCAGHDHAERSASLNVPQVNMVDDSCAFHLHFVNWYKNRVTSGSIGGFKEELAPLDPQLLDDLDRLYQAGKSTAQAGSLRRALAWETASSVGVPVVSQMARRGFTKAASCTTDFAVSGPLAVQHRPEYEAFTRAALASDARAWHSCAE